MLNWRNSSGFDDLSRTHSRFDDVSGLHVLRLSIYNLMIYYWVLKNFLTGFVSFSILSWMSFFNASLVSKRLDISSLCGLVLSWKGCGLI